MSTKVDLLTSDSQLEAFYRLADTRKQTVSVNKDALNQLLIDYNRMHEALRASGSFVVTTPQAPKRARGTIA